MKGINVIDLLEDAKEALRQERRYEYIIRFAPYILLACFIILVATGIGVWWHNLNANKAEKVGSHFYEAIHSLEQGEVKKALSELEQLIKEYPDFKPIQLVKLQKAGILMQEKRYEEAKVVYRDIAQGKGEAVIKELALLLEMTVPLKQGVVTPELVQQLQEYQKRPSPWLELAKEMLAMAYLMQNQEKEASLLLLELQKEPSLPQAMKQRVEQLLSTFSDSAREVSTPAVSPASDNTKH